MTVRGKPLAFSLLEVVIAVAVFAAAIVVILALLPALSRRAGDSSDLLTAHRLPDAVQVELRRLATGDFNTLASRIPEMSAPLENGFELVASHDGARLHSVDYLAPALSAQIPDDERYFLIEVWRFNQAPLRYDPTGASLAAYVRVSWPYRVRGASSPTALENRTQFTFSTALMR